MNSTAASVSSSRGIKCQRRPHLNRQTKMMIFLNVMKNVGIFVIVFRVRRAFRSHISTECYAIYRAFGMQILIAFSWCDQQLLRPRPANSQLGRLPLSTSSIPHPETRFGRLILKEVDFNAELFVKATCQNRPLTPLLKSPLIHLPLSLPLKVLFP